MPTTATRKGRCDIAILFPDNERQALAEIHRGLGRHLDFACRLLRYWIGADLDRGFNRSPLPPNVRRVVFAMSVKSCRQFRSVIELCERGEGSDASVIARSMFETALVVGFILKPRFTPRQFHPNGMVKKTIRVSGVSLTREFRASLFEAHHMLDPERFAAQHSARPGMRREVKRVGRLLPPAITDEYKQRIGPEWTKILMAYPFTYSGLSIANLARSLGRPFPGWYDNVYGHQSRHVHAQDMLHHMAVGNGMPFRPRWRETVEQLRRTLETAIGMFLKTIGMLIQHGHFGVAVNTAVDGFADEAPRLLDAE